MVAKDVVSANAPSPSFDLAKYWSAKQQQVEAALALAVRVENHPHVKPEYIAKICEAMRYSLLAGGKRLRPIMCLAACELAGGSAEPAMPTACAAEMIHTMSLIHDDLPALDNDDYRRGKPTNHKQFGEDIAILAGDALLAYAFEFIAARTEGVPSDRVLAVIRHLSHVVGVEGLVGGQVMDLEAEGQTSITKDQLRFIHVHKTSVLIEACVVCGGTIAGLDDSSVQALSRYGKSVGLAFQIVDDILDITSSSEVLGKTAGKDVQAQKATYPSLWGLEASQQQARELASAAKAELSIFGDRAAPLAAIADFITSRDR